MKVHRRTCEARLRLWGYRLTRDDERGPYMIVDGKTVLGYTVRAAAVEPERCQSSRDQNIVAVAGTLADAYRYICEEAARCAVWQAAPTPPPQS